MLPVDPGRVTSATFPVYADLGADLKQVFQSSAVESNPGLQGAALFEDLDAVRKAGLLNIYPHSLVVRKTIRNFEVQALQFFLDFKMTLHSRNERTCKPYSAYDMNKFLLCRTESMARRGHYHLASHGSGACQIAISQQEYEPGPNSQFL